MGLTPGGDNVCAGRGSFTGGQVDIVLYVKHHPVATIVRAKIIQHGTSGTPAFLVDVVGNQGACATFIGIVINDIEAAVISADQDGVATSV